MSFSPTKPSSKFKFEQGIAFYPSYNFSSQTGKYISHIDKTKKDIANNFFNKFDDV